MTAHRDNADRLYSQSTKQGRRGQKGMHHQVDSLTRHADGVARRNSCLASHSCAIFVMID